MTTKKPRPPLKFKALRPMAPDDPFFRRGFVVGGFISGSAVNVAKPTGPTAMPITDDESRKQSLAAFRAKIRVAGPDSPIYKGGLTMTSVRVSRPSTQTSPPAPSSAEPSDEPHDEEHTDEE